MHRMSLYRKDFTSTKDMSSVWSGYGYQTYTGKTRRPNGEKMTPEERARSVMAKIHPPTSFRNIQIEKYITDQIRKAEQAATERCLPYMRHKNDCLLLNIDRAREEELDLECTCGYEEIAQKIREQK